MKKLLLHCCCAVCASSVIERLLAQGEYEITAFFSNSNIMPKEEYIKRRDALSQYMSKVCPNVLLIEDEYDNERYSVVLMDKDDRTKQIQSWTNISIDEVVKVIEG